MRFFLPLMVVIVVAVGCSSSPDIAPEPRPAVSVSAAPTLPPTVVAIPDRPELAPTSAPTPSPPPTVMPAVVIPQRLKPLDLEPAFPDLEQYDGPVGMASPDDGSDRLFLILQRGQIGVFENRHDVTSAEIFLDIRERVNDKGNEEGLLGLAFDPAYGDNGYLYVYYSAANPRRSVVSRFHVDASDPDLADPASERVVLEVRQPFQNHNGGHLAFGDDGYLYIGLGDGGGGGDPDKNGQNLSTLLGSILRIDVGTLDNQGVYTVPPDNPFVGTPGARPEIWTYGFRNPWRFSFDSGTGDLWVADVGQNAYEEVDLVRRGANYGWNVMEGQHCFGRGGDCDTTALERPVVEYGRDAGCSVTGGYVYRGNRVPSLLGAYVYGDFCSGRLWALRHDGQRLLESISLADTTLRISSFGQDQQNELYVLSIDGRILQFVPGGGN